jgi:predicted lipid-binding transport protein (Tim44 family)
VLSSKLWGLALGCVLALTAQAVSAKQLGAETGDKPSVHVSQRSDVVLAQAVPSVAAAGSAAVLTAVPKSVLGTVIGGAATGLGLAWLASTLGFGDAVAQLLLMALIAAAVVLAVGLLRQRRTTAPSGLALQSASSDNSNGSGKSQLDPVTPRGYSSNNVGNDASARPWEQHPAMPEQAADPMTDPVFGSTPSWGVPDGFDTVGFLKASKANFVSLQAAWDRSDIAALRAMMTDGMLEQIKVQLAEREQIQGEAETANQTDVVMLEARLLGLEEIGPGYLASVEFSGLIREDASAGPNPFREVWNITRAKSGPGGWLVAGVQALQ